MKAFYPGSFDPFTNGHLYVVRQAAAVFDQVIVGVGENVTKARTFPPDVMAETINQTLKLAGIANARALAYDSLTSQAAVAVGAGMLVRGLRNGVDYAFEENLASLNHKWAGLETVYFRGGEQAHISASTVMELVRFGADVSELVPAPVWALIQAQRER